MRKDITSIEDIKLLVDTFYTAVRQDDVLGPVFNGKIGDQWPKHLDTMYRFWQTILLPGEFTYRGTPFASHINLPINETHFEKWLMLFTQTVENHFEGPVAEEAKMRAGHIASVFQHKLSVLREHSA
jgi:hemoglobin